MSVRRERCLRVRVRRLRRAAGRPSPTVRRRAGSSPDAQRAQAAVRAHAQVALELLRGVLVGAAARIVTVALPLSALT